MLNIFKHKKTTKEIIQEQYKKSLDEITEHYNGVRVNETLLGKIRSAKMDEIIEPKNDNIKVQSSVPRPKDFGTDMFAWLEDIKSQAKDVMNKLNQYKKEEEEYLKQLEEKKQKEFAEKRRAFFKEIGFLTEVK